MKVWGISRRETAEWDLVGVYSKRSLAEADAKRVRREQKREWKKIWRGQKIKHRDTTRIVVFAITLDQRYE